jgi:hypothetical protein
MTAAMHLPQFFVKQRQPMMVNRYVVTVPDPRLDLRLAASMAVGPDALLAR